MKIDRNTTLEFTLGAAMTIPEEKEAIEKSDEELNGKRELVPKFEVTHSLTHNCKGKPNSNSSSHIHSVCTIAITTQDGSNAAREWKDKGQESREATTKKRKKSERTDGRTHAKSAEAPTMRSRISQTCRDQHQRH